MGLNTLTGDTASFNGPTVVAADSLRDTLLPLPDATRVGPDTPMALDAPHRGAFEAVMAGSLRGGDAPEVVAEVIVAAATDPNPRTRSLAGSAAGRPRDPGPHALAGPVAPGAATACSCTSTNAAATTIGIAIATVTNVAASSSFQAPRRLALVQAASGRKSPISNSLRSAAEAGRTMA